MNLLVVGDLPMRRGVVARILRTRGHAVEEAQDPETALAICRQRMPEAILLGLQLTHLSGGMDEQQFVNNLRRMTYGFKAEVVVIRELGTEQGKMTLPWTVRNYIKSPFSIEDLKRRFGVQRRQ